MSHRKLELLSPAQNADTAIQAILHGADAVYIGPPSHGARKSASNSIDDIERVVDFAHQYRAKVYATVNTIVYENEVRQVETLCRDLYKAGVDALIIQDMSLLRMNLPPIALHASTQCDIRTPEKAKFLQDIGFSQIVLARELSLNEIREITETVSIPVETFVHGALCVCYSGRCHASLAVTGRSANRGECAQICRFPYTLTDNKGNIICKDRYLLSLKDFNASHSLIDLINAGVSSFKIEGRLKDLSYVKNITGYYNHQLNDIVESHPDEFMRSSYGKVSLNFQPKVDKSFNRGFTDYFLQNTQPPNIVSMLTPKSQGELIKETKELRNGDGISFYDKNGNFTGVNVNKIINDRIIPARKIEIPKTGKIYRTYDIQWEKIMSGNTSSRKIALEIKIDNKGIWGKDERGVCVRLPLPSYCEKARKEQDYKSVFEKLGNTIYFLENFVSYVDKDKFYRISELTSLKRDLLQLLDKTNSATYIYDYRRKENYEVKYLSEKLDFRDNVSNKLAEKFYRDHGVKTIESAAEVSKNIRKGDVVMTTRHCVLRELGLCKKEKGKTGSLSFPLYLNYDGGKFQLDFDCKNCEMKVLFQ